MNELSAFFETLKKDFNRTPGFQGRLIVFILRSRYFVHNSIRCFPLKIIPSAICTVVYIIFCKLLHNCDVSSDALLGAGIRFVHPYNIIIIIIIIIIADGVVIGKNCKLLHEVTIGYASRHGKTGVPTIKDNVEINAGAKIVGPITIGSNVKIGVNAVVYSDIPDNCRVLNIVEVRKISTDKQA